MSDPLNILNLGAGVQSTALLLMSLRGDLPKIDCAIFADTQWEPRDVYTHLEWLEGEAAKAGVPVHRVTRGDLRKASLQLARNETREEGVRYASVPLHILTRAGEATKLSRQCTHGYKILPIEQFIRQKVLGLASGQRIPADAPFIRQWFGITADEMERTKVCPDKWRSFLYPFVNYETTGGSLRRPEFFPKPWSRQSCVDWLEANYPGRVVPRSACIACPYRNNKEWRVIQADPAAWADAVEYDRKLREPVNSSDRVPLNGLPFVHRELKPLTEIDFRSDDDKSGQLGIWGIGNECEGMCGL